MSISQQNQINRLLDTVTRQSQEITELRNRVSALEAKKKPGRPRKVNTLQDVAAGTVA